MNTNPTSSSTPENLSGSTKTRNLSFLGILAALFSFFSFSLLDVSVKIFAGYFSVVEQAVLLRIVLSIVLGGAMCTQALAQKSLYIFRSPYPLSHIARGVLMVIFTLAFTIGFRALPLATAYSIVFMLPVVTSLIAIFVMKEHIPPLIWMSIAGGFLGILIVLRPGIAPWNWGYLALFVAVVSEAPFFILARKYHQKDHPLALLFYPQIVSAIILFVVFYVFGKHSLHTVDFSKFYGILIMSVLNVLAQSTMNYSLTKNDTNISVSMQYSQMLWGLLFGYFIFKQAPSSPLFVLGTIIIILSGYVVSTGSLPFRHAARSKKNR